MAYDHAAVMAERQRRDIETKAAHPHLIADDGRMSDYARAAKNARILLKQAFPHIKFAVRSEGFAGGSAIKIEWVVPDLHTQDEAAAQEVKAMAGQVETLVGVFSSGSFDAMTDSFNYDSDADRESFRRVFGSAKYVNVEARSETPEEQLKRLTKAAKQIAAVMPEEPVRSRRPRI